MMEQEQPFDLSTRYVVMDGDGAAIPVPVSNTFFADLERQFGDFAGKRLVAHFTFDQDWDSWEMHPAGDEFVYLLSGRVELILEQNGAEDVIPLKTPGTYALVPRGIWHTARVLEPSSMLFITPGAGTQHRSH
ncbi:MAG: cupin domain-containing protein [Cyanobacteria bacterium J06638_20]